MTKLIAIILLCSSLTFAQKPATTADVSHPASPEVIAAPAAAQQEIAELNRQAEEATLAVELAKSRLETVKQRIFSAVYKAMAEVGCSESRCTVKLDKGEVVFERKPDPTPGAPAQAKPPSQTPSKP
jgi:hypothetical protein